MWHEAHALLQQLFFTWTFHLLHFSGMIHCGSIILFSEKKRIFGVLLLTAFFIQKLGVRCFWQLRLISVHSTSLALGFSCQQYVSAISILLRTSFCRQNNLPWYLKPLLQQEWCQETSKGLIFLCWDCQEGGSIKVNSSQEGGHLPSS